MTTTQTLNVDLGANSYPIIIGEDILGQQDWACYIPNSQAIIITDSNVAEHHLNHVETVLNEHSIKHSAITIPAGEGSKSLAQLEQILDQVFAQYPERKTTLIALGGGVVGDITGFAASMVLRGVNFIQIPTSLLAQVDSSVGGKTAINHPRGKNIIGSFYQPKAVFIDLKLLATLPEREFLSGYAEVLKYALINDKAFFYWLDEHKEAILQRDPETLASIIHKSCQMKADIVSQDEKESGKRALLNLGHTFGHALETETGYGDTLLHGEAVAIGMVMAMELGVQAGHDTKEAKTQLINHLDAMGIPSSALQIKKQWDAQRLLAHMQHDKKIENGKMVFIVPTALGASKISKTIAPEMVQKTLEISLQAR